MKVRRPESPKGRLRVFTCNFLDHLSIACLFATDGLYVLLRPEKKPRNRSPNNHDYGPTIPPHLAHLEMTEPMAETCPWSLSGPQFPIPTAIQQRYCYPKGTPEYSSRKGGALWTMCGPNNAENVEYRLLHVYFSAKRAVNKGIDSDEIEREQAKRHHDDSSYAASTETKSPGSMAKKKKKTSTLAHDRGVRSPWQQRLESKQQKANKGMTKNSVRTPVAAIKMPAKLSVHSPLMPKKKVARRQSGESSWTSPSATSTGNPHQGHGASFGGNAFYPVGSFDAHDSIAGNGDGSMRSVAAAPSVALAHHFTSTSRNVFRNEAPETSEARAPYGGVATHNSFLDGREDSFDLIRGMESLVDYMNDPMSLWLKPSEEYMQPPSTSGRHPVTNVREQQLQQHQRPIEPCSSNALAHRLEGFHKYIRDMILNCPPSERGEFLSAVANWASCLARSPLEHLPKPQEADGIGLEDNHFREEATDSLMPEEETDSLHATAV